MFGAHCVMKIKPFSHGFWIKKNICMFCNITAIRLLKVTFCSIMINSLTNRINRRDIHTARAPHDLKLYLIQILLNRIFWRHTLNKWLKRKQSCLTDYRCNDNFFDRKACSSRDTKQSDQLNKCMTSSFINLSCERNVTLQLVNAYNYGLSCSQEDLS